MTKTEQAITFVCGHRNPDVDSVAAAYALAELRHRQGMENIQAICAGVMPERASWLFQHFGVTPPAIRNDVHVRLRDIAEQDFPMVQADATLFDAVATLKEAGVPRLPIVESDKTFLGMLSPLAMLSNLLNIGTNSGNSLTGRHVKTSIELICQALSAQKLVGFETDKIQDFSVYVAAMSQDNFDRRISAQPAEGLAIIVGDRPEIHLRALSRKVRLLIVTGDCPVESLVLEEAAQRQVSVIRTPFDSAKVTRRLKFAMPVRYADLPVENFHLTAQDLMRDVRSEVLAGAEDIYPVLDEDNRILGVVQKSQFSGEPPFRMILVDHNEISQGIVGLEEIPVVEVVDHHRIGMKPTEQPIKFTGDVVGSTCTLVAQMFRGAGESLTPELAGILLGGLVCDTLDLKSPTTSPLDFRMRDWLEKISGAKGSDLMTAMMTLESPLVAKSAEEVINSDRKNYSDSGMNFAVAQVEENNLELLAARLQELDEVIRQTLEQDGLDFFALLVTDPVRGNSKLLIRGAAAVIRKMPFERNGDGVFNLPGVLSRKKQLLPQLLSIIR